MAAGAIDPIPMDKWSMKSRSDSESNLLQGVRISNEFINALMWMATRYLKHQKLPFETVRRLTVVYFDQQMGAPTAVC